MSHETDVIDKVENTTDVKLPNMFKVILHNDNTTTMDFVIHVLMNIFHRKIEEAIELTGTIHETGQGIAGAPYTKEIAEQKTTETVAVARANGYPLIATFEEV